jgi:inorganic pyrophosphatase
VQKRLYNTAMDLSKLSVGQDPPRDINVLVEISQGGPPVKYEFDKEAGVLAVDRFLHTAMFYPGNYGFVPHTLSADGDPIDVLVVSQVPVVPGCVVRIAVPVDKLHPYHSGVESHEDLPAILREQIAHFFQHYKDLEKGKWVTIVRWVGPNEAGDLILDAIARAKKS